MFLLLATAFGIPLSRHYSCDNPVERVLNPGYSPPAGSCCESAHSTTIAEENNAEGIGDPQ